MADTRPSLQDPLASEDLLGIVRDALHPDERKFMQNVLGQESPGFLDYVTQQGRDRFHQARTLRNTIIQNVMNSVLPSANNPNATLGQARSIDPNFPAPPQAQTPMYGEAQGPGAPVPTGVTPGQGFSQEQLNQPTSMGTMQDSINRLSPSSSAFMQEGPRPTAPMPYSQQEDMNALLPRSHQNLLAAIEHRKGLRPFSPNSTLKSDLYQHFTDLSTGTKEEAYPGELQAVSTMLGVTPKAPGANTAQGRLATANASLAEQKAQRYAGLTDAQITTMEARQQADKARAKDLTDLLGGRQRKIESEITKNLAQGKAAGDLVGLNKEKAYVQSARFLLTLHKLQSARDNLDQQSSDEAINELLKLGGSELQLQRDEPGFLKGLFGGSGSSHLVPHSDLPVPQGQPPSGNPMQFKPGDITSPEQGGIVNPEPIGNVQPAIPAQDKQAAAKALYDRMKEGEVQTFDGTKYKKQGSKLVPVK